MNPTGLHTPWPPRQLWRSCSRVLSTSKAKAVGTAGERSAEANRGTTYTSRSHMIDRDLMALVGGQRSTLQHSPKALMVL
jgi:hypothetical protein